jgi:hypothetical protein
VPGNCVTNCCCAFGGLDISTGNRPTNLLLNQLNKMLNQVPNQVVRGVESPRTPQLTPAHSRTQSLEAERFFGGGGGGAGGGGAGVGGAGVGGAGGGGAGGGVGGGGFYSYSLGAKQRSATLEMSQQKEVVYHSVRQVQQGNAVCVYAVVDGLEDAHRRMQVSLLPLTVVVIVSRRDT